MKEIKKDIDVVVIFKKIYKKNLTMFVPKFITIGKLDSKTMKFRDIIDQRTYSHLVIGDGSEYGYGLRINLKNLRALYGIKDINELFDTYLKELKQRKYYFRYKNGEEIVSNLIFVSEDKKYGDILVEPDKDLDKILKSYDPFNDINKLISDIKDNVVGQDDAIEELVSVLWKNSRRDVKRNILLIGPTGVGKTEIMRTLEKKLNIPITIVDVSSFTQTGYKGDSVEDILKRIIIKCNGDLKKAKRSIVVLDEFDKLAKKGLDDGGVATVGVQHELLKLLEDGEYTVELGDDLYSNKVTLNTKGMTFIVAGAFSDLFVEEKQYNSNPIGFNRTKLDAPAPTRKKKITTEDIVNYGIIKEATGRLHNVIVLNQLTLDNLVSIMKNPNSYMLNDNIKIFEELGITVNINPSVYEKIGKLALDKKTGARGLIGTIENLFSKASLDAKRNTLKYGYNYLEITDETVVDNSKYVLKRIKKDEKK